MSPQKITPALLTTRQVAELLNVSIQTVARLHRSGKLTAVYIRGAVRFPVEEVQKIITKKVAK